MWFEEEEEDDAVADEMEYEDVEEVSKGLFPIAIADDLRLVTNGLPTEYPFEL